MNVRRHRDAVCARLFRNTCKPGSVRVNAIQMSFYRRLLERGEINPTILFVNADDCLAHPERDSARARECPLSFSDLVLECAVDTVAIKMHEAVAFGRPKEVLTVIEEVKVVSHVHPTGIRL